MFVEENQANIIAEGIRIFGAATLKKVNDFLFFSWKGSRSRYKYRFCIGFHYGGEW